MQNPLELSIKGIKFDNPKCGYHNDNVEFREYEQWLNKPCPKCGANLLTQEMNGTGKIDFKIKKED